MKLTIYITLLFATIVNMQLLTAQNTAIDSLLQELETVTNDTSKVDVLLKIGHKHLDINPEKGLKYSLQALRIAEDIKDTLRIADANFVVGQLEERSNNEYKALTWHQKALKIYEKLGLKEKKRSCYRSIGFQYKRLGDCSNALKYYLKALNISKELGIKNKIAVCFTDIGWIKFDEGKYDEAVELKKQALRIYNELGDKNNISNSLINIGISKLEQSRYNEAAKYYQQALEIHEELGSKKGVSDCLFRIGLSVIMQGDYGKAIPYVKKSLTIAKELNYKNNIMLCLASLGFISESQNKYDEATRLYKRSLILAQEIGRDISTINTNILLANLHVNQGDYNGAQQYLQGAFASNISDFDNSTTYSNWLNSNALCEIYLLRTLNIKAKMFYLLSKKGNYTKNIETSILNYKIAFDLINKMRIDYNRENTKFLLSEKSKRSFTVAILAAIKYNKINPEPVNLHLAFGFIEKLKSSTLNAHISDSRMKQTWDIPDSVCEKEKNIVAIRRFYETKIQKAKAKKGGYDTLLVQDYEDKLFDYSCQYDTIINSLKENFPDYYQLKYEQNVASINEVQKQLGENSALLNYFVGDTTLFIAAVNKDTLIYKTITIDSYFTQQIIDYHIDIKSGFGKKEIKSSNQLYGYLIKPVKDIIADKDHLVIIPDEYLNYVPFETLCKDTDLSHPSYLIKDYAVNYHYSATLWLNSKKKAEKNTIAGNNFIGFAPVFDPKVNNGYILSSEWLSDTTDVEVATRSVSSDLKNFNALPYSEKEIKAILKLFKKKGGKADGYFYKEATEKSFKQKAENYKYVHIASHSFTNDNYPALSGIAFSQPDTTGFNGSQYEDGILYAGESYNLNLAKAELVVLSSCKSGLGKLVKGEGFLSLSRGFLYAGTPNIVFSLWNVKDEATKDLMVEFYKQLLNGKTYADALRMAKLKLIKSSKTKEPKYWGAWVLVGR